MVESNEGNMMNKIFLHAPIVKSGDDNYLAVLTDTSIDRDNEIVGKSFMEKAVTSDWLPGLMDHENKALNLLCNWEDKQMVETSPGKFSLIAKPKWFLSNPNALIMKKMIDEGAKMGLSITAIPKAHDEVVIEAKTYKRWTDGEIISADFVGIPANKHAMALRVAKSFSLNKGMEEDTMTPEEVKEIAKDVYVEMQKKPADAPAPEPEASPEPAKDEPKEPEPKKEPAPEPKPAEPEKAPEPAKKEEAPKEAPKSAKREEALNKLPNAEPAETTKTVEKDVSQAFIKAQAGRK